MIYLSSTGKVTNKNPLLVAVGLNVKRLRAKRGITQRELAKHIKRSEPLISKIENAACGLGEDTIWAMAQYFKVKPEEFFKVAKGRPKGVKTKTTSKTERDPNLYERLRKKWENEVKDARNGAKRKRNPE